MGSRGGVERRHATAAGMLESIPAMPLIEAHELYAGPPFVIADSGRFCIGWEKRSARKGGDCFVVARRTFLEEIKILERFRLTEDGWAQAWRALVRADAASAQLVLAKLEERASLARSLAAAAELDARSLGCLPGVVFLGGYGTGALPVAGQSYDVRFLDSRLLISMPCQADAAAEISYADIEEVEIGGPGQVRRWSPALEAGMIAAFGLTGALVAYGSTKIETVVRVQGADCEWFFLQGRTKPDALRIELSRALYAIREARARRAQISRAGAAGPPGSPVEELTRLASMLQEGLLTRAEFDRLKTKLIAEA